MSPLRALIGSTAVLLAAMTVCASGSAAATPPPAAAPAPAAAPDPAASATGAEAGGGPAARAAALVDGMTAKERALSIVMGHIPTTDPAALSAYMGTGLGGFILMGANIPEASEGLRPVVDALVTDSALPPLIAVDQEGGIVSRLPGDDYPASTTLKNLPPSEAADAFAARGSLVARAGIGVNFGTVADVPPDPGSFIYGRALGLDPRAAAERVTAATTTQEPFVASTLKHFPGHGPAPGDSHSGIPPTSMSLEQWRAADAVPFAAGIDAGASLIMFGHLAYTAVDAAPASLSSVWHGIAREELGFDGVIVTDDLGMLLSSGVPEYADPVANAVRAVVAGSDLVLMIAGSTPETAGDIAAGLVDAVGTGVLPAARLEEAAVRVMTLRLREAAASATWELCGDCAPVG